MYPTHSCLCLCWLEGRRKLFPHIYKSYVSLMKCHKRIHFPLNSIIRSVYGVLVDPNEPQWSYYGADDIVTLSHNAVITSINHLSSSSLYLAIDPPVSPPTHYLVTANTRYRSAQHQSTPSRESGTLPTTMILQPRDKQAQSSSLLYLHLNPVFNASSQLDFSETLAL